MTLAQQLESYLDIAGWEDALGLSNHPLQPVLIDCVEEVNDGSFLETQFLLSLTLKLEESPRLLPWRRLARERVCEREREREREKSVCMCVYERE